VHSITRRLALTASACLVAVVVACGGDSSTGPKNVNLSGNWGLTASISNSGLAITCSATGNLAITQTGSNFSGNISGSSELCTGPGGSVTASIDGQIGGGQINGTSVSWTDGMCNYTGTMSGNPVNRVSGNISCSIPIQGTSYPFNGQWTVIR